MLKIVHRLRRVALSKRIVAVVGLIVGVSHLMAMTAYALYSAAELSRARERHVADQVVTLTRLFDELPAAERRETARKLSDYSLQISIDELPRIVPNDSWASDATALRELLGFAIGGAVSERVLADYREVTGDDLALVDVQDLPDREMFASRILQLFRLRQDLLVCVRLDDEGWLNVLAPGPSLVGVTDSVVVLLVLSIGLVAIVLVVRLVASPLRMLSGFVDRVERLNPQTGRSPLPQDGPSELRRLASAINALHNRALTLLEERSHMTAAIGRDLPAPLARLGLRAQDVADERQRRKMLEDIGHMESMVAALGRSGNRDLAQQPRFHVDLVQMLAEVAEEFELPALELNLRGVEGFTYECVPTAMRQAFAHVVSNAVTFGRRASICMEVRPDSVLVLIDDEGPRLSPEEVEKVFLSFYRLEPARARNPGGVGLGLAIAREIVRAHGGDVSLLRRPDGKGNRARIMLPLAGVGDHAQL